MVKTDCLNSIIKNKHTNDDTIMQQVEDVSEQNELSEIDIDVELRHYPSSARQISIDRAEHSVLFQRQRSNLKLKS